MTKVRLFIAILSIAIVTMIFLLVKPGQVEWVTEANWQTLYNDTEQVAIKVARVQFEYEDMRQNMNGQVEMDLSTYHEHRLSMAEQYDFNYEHLSVHCKLLDSIQGKNGVYINVYRISDYSSPPKYKVIAVSQDLKAYLLAGFTDVHFDFFLKDVLFDSSEIHNVHLACKYWLRYIKRWPQSKINQHFRSDGTVHGLDHCTAEVKKVDSIWNVQFCAQQITTYVPSYKQDTTINKYSFRVNIEKPTFEFSNEVVIE